MLKFLLQFLCVFSFLQSIAQDNSYNALPVNLDYVFKEIKDENSSYFYPNLLEKFKNNDTTLTIMDYRFLYYGYAKQHSYKPYGISKHAEEIQKILFNKELKNDDYLLLEEKIAMSLTDDPFDLKMIVRLINVYKYLKKEDLAEKLIYKHNMLIDTILGSGDGLSCETAFQVINVSDEYVILNVFGFQSKSQAMIDGTCDFLTLEDPNKEIGIDGIYFNIEIPFKKLYENTVN